MVLAKTPFRHDRRIVASDDDHLVLRIKPPEEPNPATLFLISALVAAFVAVGLWFLLRPPAWIVLAIWLAITIAAALYAMTEGTLVALRNDDQLFIEWRNVLTRQKRRTVNLRLTQLEKYEIHGFADIDTDLVPNPIYELRLRAGETTATWYCDSRELAKAVGDELIRLKRMAVHG